jgi:biopolymer transport protein TolR
MATTSTRMRVRRTKNEINMVPFIDVMLVLLIIFMVTAPLITPSQIDLPSVGQASAPPKAFVQVLINKQEQIRVSEGPGGREGTVVPMDQLVSQVRQMQAASGGDEAVPVVIGADKSIKYEKVIQVLDTLQRAGIQRVGLSVQATR